MPYDYCSLMHYGATAFGARGAFTLVTKDLDYLAVIGRSHARGADLTYTDAMIVNKMYGVSFDKKLTSGCFGDRDMAVAIVGLQYKIQFDTIQLHEWFDILTISAQNIILNNSRNHSLCIA